MQQARWWLFWRDNKEEHTPWFYKSDFSIIRNLLKFTEIYWNLLKFTEIYWNLLKFTEIYWNLVFSLFKTSKRTWLAFAAAEAATATEAAPEVATSQQAATPEKALKLKIFNWKTEIKNI